MTKYLPDITGEGYKNAKARLKPKPESLIISAINGEIAGAIGSYISKKN